MTQHITCFGEMLLRLSAPGKELLLQSPSFQVHVGGAEANVAVSLRKLGHRTSMVTTLPDNALGHASAGELRRHGVEVDAVRFAPGRMGIYFLTHGAMSRPSEVLYDRADSAFAKADAGSYDWASALKNSDWLHVTGITPAVSAAAADAALHALRQARSQGAKTSFDCNFRAKLWAGRTAEAPVTLRRFAKEADLLLADPRDIEFIFGADFGRRDDAAARATSLAFDAFPQLQWIAATTRARETVDVQEYAGTLRTRSGVYASRSHKLIGIVDRIGGGDAFAAALIDQLLTVTEPQAAIEFAVAAAVLKHSISGDFNLAGRDEIAAVLAELTDVRR